MIHKRSTGLADPSKSVPDSKILLAAAFSALLVLLLLLMACEEKKVPVAKEVVRPVKMMTIGTGTEAGGRSFPGKVRASRRVDLAFQVSGPLVKLPVEEGEEIKKGAVIARILPRDFETELKKARAESLAAEQQFERYKALYARKQVSKADFDKFRSTRDVAKAQEKAARDALDDTYLKAPFNGVVARRYVENFQDIRAKEPVVSLQDISEVEILVAVPEILMAGVRTVGAEVGYAQFAAAPGEKFPVTLKEYATEADPQTQTFQVTLLMSQPDTLNVLPGMTATVTRTTPDQPDSIETVSGVTVPAIAVFADENGESQVWIVDQSDKGMTVRPRRVSTGQLTGREGIEIVEGLVPGETIAVSGVTHLREGMAVRPMTGY